MLINC